MAQRHYQGPGFPILILGCNLQHAGHSLCGCKITDSTSSRPHVLRNITQRLHRRRHPYSYPSLRKEPFARSPQHSSLYISTTIIAQHVIPKQSSQNNGINRVPLIQMIFQKWREAQAPLKHTSDPYLDKVRIILVRNKRGEAQMS